MRRALKIAALALAALVALFVLLVGGLTLSEWWPPPDESLKVSGGAATPLPAELKLLTWNIGYAAMDSETDFFMDGGRMSHGRSAEAVQANLAAITAVLREHKPDLVMLQEVDMHASRSYGIDERGQLEASLKDYAAAFTTNYNVPYVPVPFGSPMGGVRSGLLTLTRTTPAEAHGLRLPGRQAWPNRLFNLKRMLTLVRLPAPGGKQLVLINAHLTAFDSVGNMRPLELAYLRERILAEQSAGSYVIVGGDWNSAMPGGKTPACDKSQDDRSWLIDMPADFIAAGWTWAAGLNAPTVRTLGAPRNSRSTCYAYIDGMLLSPGVELRRASTVDLNFQNSDHNPVEVEVTLH